MELLKATQLARPRMISVKLLEKRMSQVGLMAPLPADLPPRPVDRALPNFARQLKWVSASRLIVAKPMAPAKRPPRLQAQQKIQAPRSHRRAQVFCWPDRQRLIPLRDRSAIARFLCSYQPTRSASALCSLPLARP